MAERKKVNIIVNPTAGRGAGQASIPRIEALLKNLEVSYLLQRTERPWHAAQLAQRAVEEGYGVVAAVGGDGTSNEVLNGLMRAKEALKRTAVMGIISVGRGNDFAYGAGVPKGVETGCAILARGRKRLMDVGRVSGGLYPQGRYFGNGIGIGFDTIVGFEAAKITWLSGFPSYFVAALKTMFLYYKAPLVEMEFGGRVLRQKAILISVMNGRRMGGAFMMAPQSLNDDGAFDLCIAGEVKQVRMLGLILKYMKGTQAESELIQTGRTSHFAIRALEGKLAVHADGETICEAGEGLTAECLPKQIEILSEAADAL